MAKLPQRFCEKMKNLLQDEYDDFIKGAKSGLITVAKILPTLIALMVGVGILRSSGFLTFLGSLIQKLPGGNFLAADLYSLIFIKIFSGSAATGLVLDIFKTYGADSFIGRVASVIAGSTETTFYTIAVYFGAVGVTKTRHTAPSAVAADITGFILSAVFVSMHGACHAIEVDFLALTIVNLILRHG